MPDEIMIVDDEPDTVQLVKTILEGGGYAITEAYSGSECLEELKTDHPNLILLDIMMPDMSGWDTYDQIREKDKNVKVAFLSVIKVSNERKEKLVSEGLSDYITKPFTVDELLGRVGRILSK